MGKYGQAKKGRGAVTALKTVTTKGTPEALSADHTFVKYVIVQALEANTGNVLVGDSNVDYTTDQGTQLAPLNSMTLEGVYLDEVYVDVDVDGEGVSITYEQTL